MPREATISYDQVARYAEDIKAEGGKPTPRLIRGRHGSGSLGTIHRLFQEWESTRALAIEAALILPPSIHRVILEFVRNELSAARTDIEERLNQVTVCAEDLAAENERQLTEIQNLSKTIELLQGDKATLEGRIREIDAASSAFREESSRERKTAELARTEVAKMMLRLEGLPRIEAELDEARKESQLISRCKHEAEKELAVVRSELQLLEKSKNETVAALQARLSDAQRELQMALTQLKETQAERIKITAELASAQAMRAEEGSRIAERIGVLEGALTVLNSSSNENNRHARS